MTDIYLTPEQVAQRLHFHVESVYRLLRNGKLRGVHISRKAWRISEHDFQSFMKSRDAADLLFEEYVAAHGLGNLDREPVISGKSRRMDYRLPFKGRALWFEVREFAEGAESLGSGGRILDPYLWIRREIDEAAEMTPDHAGGPRCLVFYSRDLNMAEICTPSVVFGAMLGHGGWRIQTAPEHGGVGGKSRQVRAGSGQADGQPLKLINTGISAVIALERFPVGRREFHNALAKRERVKGQRLPWEEIREVLQKKKEKYERTVLRALVFENPYATKRLPSDFFAGPYDVRWAPDTGAHWINRTYIGPELAKLEAAGDEEGSTPTPLQRQTKRQRKTVPAGNLFPEL